MAGKYVRIIGTARHRLMTDGDGVTTLIAFHGCPLRCKYCINPQSFDGSCQVKEYTPELLYKETKIDELYFLATNGGVTFGGGEPALHYNFISEFRCHCGTDWHITIETSLNVPQENIVALLPVVDYWIIDIKDCNPDIYSRYTGKDNSLVIANLKQIAEASRQSDCTIRLPLIPDFNTDADREASREALTALGFSNFDSFTYQIRKH